MAAIVLDRRDRAAAAFASAGIVALLLWALVIGLTIARGGSVVETLKLFTVLPPPPPPAEQPHPVRNFRPAGEASPPNLRSKSTDVVAPKPFVELVVPPLVITAPVAGPGIEASAGAADIAGPGTGAGGEGNGFGAGGDGDGDGAGDVPPQRIGGRLKDSDYPLEAGEQGVSGTVGVRFVVDEQGRVPRCQVTRSSGSALLDNTTCRLIMQRYRFRPGHDARGIPFASTIVENETWVIHEEPPEDDGRR